MFSIAPRPRENGQQLPPYPQSPGTQTPAERNIRASSGWLWQERSTLQRINQSFSGARLLTARSIYLALTECASQQHTPGRAHTSCAYLGSIAGCSERNARRYLHEFASLGLIEVLLGVHRANTYILLGEAALVDNLAQAVIPLADGDGRSAAPVLPQRAAQSPAKATVNTVAAKRRDDTDGRPTLAHRPTATNRDVATSSDNPPTRDDMDDRPDRVRGDAGGSQDLTSESNKPKNQTNRGGGDKPGVGSVPDRRQATADGRLLIASDEQKQAITSLTGLGVRRVLAEELAANHDAAIIRAWVRYALRTAGLKSKAGFVLSRLRAGEQPPLTFTTSNSAVTDQPQPSWGRTGASLAENAAGLPTADSAVPPPSDREQAIWHAAKDELLLEMRGGARLWLQHMRLIGGDADRLILSSPPVGGASNAGIYAERIAALLGAMLGRAVQMEFQAGW